MKISIDIDCTPEEARAFFGLPDVAPMQQEVMAEIQKRIMGNLAALDPDTLLKTWLPLGAQGMEQLQKAFWAQFAAGGAGGRKNKAD